MQISLSDVNTVRRNLKGGKKATYYYHRKTGKRIEGEPGTVAFMRSYELAANADAAESVDGTFATILRTYQASPEFRGLAKTTRKNYSQRIDVLNEAFGKIDIRAFSEKKIRGTVLAWRDQVAIDYPAAAGGYMGTLSAILTFAEGRSIIDINPMRGVGRLRAATRVDCVWGHDQIKSLLAVSPDLLQWAIKLALFTGQRKGDLIKLKWADASNGYLRLVQCKTKAKVGIPLIAPIQSLLAEIPHRADTILTNRKGKPWCDVSGLTALWLRAMDDAGLRGANLRFHDLRGTAVTCLADVGCTEAEIASITGHKLEHVGKILATYLKRTDVQASAAMGKLERSWIGKL